MTQIRYFAAAAEAAGRDTEHVEAPTLGALGVLLSARHGDRFAFVWGRSSTLVDGKAETDPSTPLDGVATVDVLPPFAGG